MAIGSRNSRNRCLVRDYFMNNEGGYAQDIAKEKMLTYENVTYEISQINADITYEIFSVGRRKELNTTYYYTIYKAGSTLDILFASENKTTTLIEKVVLYFKKGGTGEIPQIADRLGIKDVEERKKLSKIIHDIEKTGCPIKLNKIKLPNKRQNKRVYFFEALPEYILNDKESKNREIHRILERINKDKRYALDDDSIWTTPDPVSVLPTSFIIDNTEQSLNKAFNI